MDAIRFEGELSLAASRLKQVSFWLLLGVGALGACHKKSEELPQKPAVAKADPAAVKASADKNRQSLEGLKPLFNALSDKFVALHKEFDPLPPDLPDFAETRGKFNGADEGLGRMAAKVPYLAGRIDIAQKSGDLAELQDISKDIERSYAEIPEVDKIALELVHQVQPFKRMAEEVRAHEKAVCEPSESGKAAAALAKKVAAPKTLPPK